MGDVIRYQKRVVEKIKTLSDSRLKAALDFILKASLNGWLIKEGDVVTDVESG
jgi:hypothetical protein